MRKQRLKTPEWLKKLYADICTMAKMLPLIFVSMVISVIYGVTNIIISSIELSFFIGITGICALIFGIAKFVSFKKFMTARAEKNQETVKSIEAASAVNIATFSSVTAFLHFSIATVCLFFQEESPKNYGLAVIFFFAGISVIKILLGIINSLRTRKNHSIIIHNIKLMDFANALISLALTQRAILYYIQAEAARIPSGIGGIFFSLCALTVCLLMFLKHKRVLQN